MNCPSTADLLAAALGADAPGHEAVVHHAAQCAACQRELTRLWEVIDTLRAAGPVDADADSHLDEGAIAALLDASEPETHAASLAHLATCVECRTRLAAVAALLRDRAIAQELTKLERTDARRRTRLLPAGAAGVVAAALAGLLLLRPGEVRPPANEPVADDAARREGIVTATVAPRIVSRGELGAEDSLRWTSVPRADLYRVTVWDRSGTVVWDGETRDTVLPLPPPLTRAAGGAWLWVVDARTGWDRWVSSELHELTVRSERGGRR
jgi:hypothetical protein